MPKKIKIANINQPKAQTPTTPIVEDNAKITDEEKEIIRQAVYKATKGGWIQGAFVLMQFPTLNVPFIFHSFFSDVKWAQAYFGKDWIAKQHEMLTICQTDGVNAVVTFLKDNNFVLEK